MIYIFADVIVDLAEIKSKNTIAKKDGAKINGEFILNVFYVLTKYTALSKLIENEESFNQRIEALREGNDEEYERLRRETDNDENNKMQQLQDIAMADFDTNEQEYVNGYQSNLMQQSFIIKMQTLQQEIVNDLSRPGDNDIPEELTKEKAIEIRDFAKTETQKTLMQLQSTMTNQAEFQEKFMFEVSKLDDIIFIKYGFKNTDVLKAFQHYNLIPNQGGQMMGGF